MLHAITQRTVRFRLPALLMCCAAILALGTQTILANGQMPDAFDVVAPELVGGPWLNTPMNAPIKLASRKGKVTIVEFWTFGCINCRHNLPIYARWQKEFEKQGVVIIGVHTPETASEKVPATVRREVKTLGITYPVLLDRQGENWNRWQQQYWPTICLIDKRGHVRYRWAGELEYNHAGGEAQMARKIRALLQVG